MSELQDKAVELLAAELEKIEYDYYDDDRPVPSNVHTVYDYTARRILTFMGAR